MVCYAAFEWRSDTSDGLAMNAPSYSVEKAICKVLGVNYDFVTSLAMEVSADRIETKVTVTVHWTEDMRKQAENILAQKDTA